MLFVPIRIAVLRWLATRPPLCWLLLRLPDLEVTEAKRAEFEELVARIRRVGGTVDYDLRWPKHEFLRYLTAHHEVLLHGSNASDIDCFEPCPQTDWAGHPIEAVFATSDGLWPVFFAVVQRRVARTLRNLCLPDGDRRWYLFAISSDPGSRRSWGTGSVYVLPRHGFAQHALQVEWSNPTAVRPMARIPVNPDDFPFLRQVIRHKPGRSLALLIFGQALTKIKSP
jgi:hypothetical protein